MATGTNDHGVVIVGAGPAGAGLALLLASRGAKVTLIERQHDFAREFRGEGMSPGGLEALAAMGVDLEASGIPRARPTELHVIIEGRPTLHIDLTSLDFRGCAPLTVSQPHLLEHLVALAARHPGFRLLRGASVRELLHDDGGRICGVGIHDDSGEQTIRARLVIGADGRASFVRRQGGFVARERATPLDVVWTRMPWPAHWKGRAIAQGHVGDGHLLIVFPSPEGQMQLAWIIPKGTYGELRKRGTEEWVRELARHTGGDLAPHLLANANRLVKPFLLRAETDRVLGWARPGALLIGDSAHTMSPVGGQGINLALRDAIVAANHLVPPLLGGAGPDMLDAAASAVEPERGPEIDRIQAIAAQPPRVVLGRGVVPRLIRRAIPLLLRVPVVRAQAARTVDLFLYGVAEVRLTI